jgi:putative transcriptional regulator
MAKRLQSKKKTEQELLCEKLGLRIREIRLEKKMTQVELAAATGKDQQSIQRLEVGGVNPSFYYLVEIARGLEIEVEKLTKGL